MSAQIQERAVSPARQFLAAHPEIQSVEVVLTDLNGIFRGKWLPRSALEKVLEGKFKMSLTSVSADIWGRDVPSLCTKTGDGDGNGFTQITGFPVIGSIAS